MAEKYLSGAERENLKSMLYGALKDKAKRRLGTTSSTAYAEDEKRFAQQRELSDIGALGAAFSNSASMMGQLGGKRSDSGSLADFNQALTNSSQNEQDNRFEMRKLEESSNMNDLRLANYLTDLDEKDDKEKTDELKREGLRRDLIQKSKSPILKKKFEASLRGPGGSAVVMDEGGNPSPLPGYTVNERPMMEREPNTGTWSTGLDGAGMPYQTNSKSGEFRQPNLPHGFTPKKPAQPAAAKTTDSQRNAAMLYGNAEQALKVLEEMEAKGFKPDWKTGAKEMLVPESLEGYAFSADEQRYRRAAEDFTAAKLRLESGANIPPGEIKQQARIYMMRPGQDSATGQDAVSARRKALDGMRTRAGGAEGDEQQTSGGGGGQKKLIRKQHNKQLGKTRFFYSDGSSEDVNGLQ